MTQNSTSVERRFVVVLRGPSAAVFDKRDMFTYQLPTVFGPVRVVYRTRWIPVKNVELPGHIWIEVSGTGSALEHVLEVYGNAGLFSIPILSFSTNAAIAHPELELGFESTPGSYEREFFQSFVPPERALISTARRVDMAATTALAQAIDSSEHHERLLRAIGQYHLALEEWRLAYSIRSVAHLWMAVEALTKVRLRTELKTRNLNRAQDLADQLGVPLKELDGTIRRQFIFHGDGDCYSNAKDASDGLEHGYASIPDLRQITRAVRDRTATHIRTEILNLLQLADDVRDKLLTEPFSMPMGIGHAVRYIRGKLVGNSDSLAREGNPYPILLWHASQQEETDEGTGKSRLVAADSLTGQFAEGITFRPVSHEVWQPH
jgi:hypothetical protein